MHGYGYLLCIHHNTWCRTIKGIEKVWCFPLTSPTPLESLRNQECLNCPAVSSTQEEATDPKQQVGFPVTQQSITPGKVYDPSDKMCCYKSLFKYLQVKSKHFHVLPLDCSNFYYLLFLNLSFLKPIVITPSLRTIPLLEIPDLIIVAITTVCLDYKNFLIQLLQVTSSYAESDLSFSIPGTAASLTVSVSYVFKLCLICPLYYEQWLELFFITVLVSLVNCPVSSRIIGPISFH